MKLANLFFIFSLSFLAGVLVSSIIALNLFYLFSFLIIILLFALLRKNFLIFFSIVFFISGYLYYNFLSYYPSLEIQKEVLAQEKFLIKIETYPKKIEKIQQTKAHLTQNPKIKFIVYLPFFEKVQRGGIYLVEGKAELASSYYQQQGYFFVIKGKRSYQISAPNFFYQTLNFIRDLFEEKIYQALPLKSASFLAGILFGAENQPKELKTAMKKTGTLHLIAMSGYNITIISSLIYQLFLWLPIPYFLVLPSTFLAIFLFVILVGAESSVVRAGIIGGIGLIFKNIGRPFLLRNVILATALVMVLVNPRVLAFDLGFQLSFLAFIGIVYLAPYLEKYIKLKSVAETLSAQILVAPLLLYKVGNFSLIGPVVNAIILPLIPYLMVLGGIILIFGFIPLINSFAPQFLGIFYLPGIKIIETFQHFGFLNYNLPLVLVLCFYIIICYYLYQLNKNETLDFNFSVS